MTDKEFAILFHGSENKKSLLHKGILRVFYDKKGSPPFIVYTGKKDISNPIEQLLKVGATTIPVIPKKDLVKIRKDFSKACDKFPEYRRNRTKPIVYVLGGFAALGNPASFHNMFVRKIRRKARNILVKKIFRPLIGTKKLKLEVLIDRMMLRYQGQQPSAEAWHRDEAPRHLLSDNDLIFGGWINFDDKDQYFSFIPGSHLGINPKNLTGGFANPCQELAQEYRKYEKLYKTLTGKKKEGIAKKKKELRTLIRSIFKKFEAEKWRITIPPGHAVIFPQYILHEVVNNPAPYDMYRLFTGYRLTTSDTCLYPNTMQQLKDQGIITLGGGMQPPMYSCNHSSNFLHKPFFLMGSKNKKYGKKGLKFEYRADTIQWSKETFKDKCLVTKPKGYKLVYRFMPSLKELGWMYPSYTQKELKIYKPCKIKNTSRSRSRSKK